jgi:hypothetical protein
MKNNLSIRKLEEYFFGSKNWDSKEEQSDLFWINSVSNYLSLTGILAMAAPYYFDSSNPEPCKGSAIIIGLTTIAYSEFIRNYFNHQIKKDRARCPEEKKLSEIDD